MGDRLGILGVVSFFFHVCDIIQSQFPGRFGFKKIFMFSIEKYFFGLVIFWKNYLSFVKNAYDNLIQLAATLDQPNDFIFQHQIEWNQTIRMVSKLYLYLYLVPKYEDSPYLSFRRVEVSKSGVKTLSRQLPFSRNFDISMKNILFDRQFWAGSNDMTCNFYK